jgi:RHS repeat-associated protein
MWRGASVCEQCAAPSEQRAPQRSGPKGRPQKRKHGSLNLQKVDYLYDASTGSEPSLETNRNMRKPIDITAGNTVLQVGLPWLVRYAYTFGGHKFLKETELEGETPEVRLYLGGAEFVNGQPESYYHGEGRVALTGVKPQFQYKLTDHLGNTMVLFEDRDGDGIITTESNPAENEVLQRNFYYAFGLPMQGPWNHTPTDPDMPYLYNGKELEGELGLGWYAYGFRYYDASVGRFVGVDPIAEHFPHVSSFNYAENRVISGIDLWGLQYVDVTSGEAVGPVDPHNSKTTIAEEYDVNGNGEQDYYLPAVDLTASRLNGGGGVSSQGAAGQGEGSGGGSGYFDSAVNITGIVAGLDVHNLSVSPPTKKLQIGYLAKNNKVYSWTQRPNGATGPKSAWRPAYSRVGVEQPWVQSTLRGAKIAGNIASGVGLLSSGYGYFGGEMDAEQTLRFGSDVTVSFVMFRFPSPYTYSVGLGWEAGRVITKYEWYQKKYHSGRYYSNPDLFPLLSK